MKNFSISKKFTLVSLSVTVLSIVIGYFTLNYYKNQLTNDVYNSIKSELSKSSKDRIKAKFDVGISNAISIANDSMIKKALLLR